VNEQTSQSADAKEEQVRLSCFLQCAISFRREYLMCVRKKSDMRLTGLPEKYDTEISGINANRRSR